MTLVSYSPNCTWLVHRPPCWNSTARHARLDSLDTSNVLSRVETWIDERSGIWAYTVIVSCQCC